MSVSLRLNSTTEALFDILYKIESARPLLEDPRVRGTRLALLNQAVSLFYRIADISKLGGNS